MKKKYLACFDLDGTLFDTGAVNYYAYKNALEEFGIELTKDFFDSECEGKNYKDFIPVIMGNTLNMEKVHDLKKNYYVTNLDKARENKHLFRMIKLMKDNYYIALVTTASRKNTLDILNYFGYTELFDFIVTQEDTTEIKPNPQGFLKAIEYFEMDASNTVIFEDSDIGLAAAGATGATVIAVNNF